MLKLGIIGCGRISGKHIEAMVQNQNEIKLVAACDSIGKRAENCVMEYCAEMNITVNEGPKVFLDYLKMLDDMDLDVISIATESGFHARISIDCMKRGKHVIVEKPMALSTRDADEMIRIAAENNVRLCVCHQNRFNPPIRKLRKAIEEDRFGKIIAGNARILWNRDINYYQQASWRGTYQLDGGCLMNQCIHNIDLLQWMLGGKIEWVHGEVKNDIHPFIEAEDYGSIQIKFANGAIGNVEGTVCVYPRNLEETLTIIGEKGTVIIGGLAVNKIETWVFADERDSAETVKAESNEEVDCVYGSGHTPLYRDMIESVKYDREPYINGEAGRIAMEIILATYESSRREKRIKFPLADLNTINAIVKK